MSKEFEDACRTKELADRIVAITERTREAVRDGDVDAMRRGVAAAKQATLAAISLGLRDQVVAELRRRGYGS